MVVEHSAFNALSLGNLAIPVGDLNRDQPIGHEDARPGFELRCLQVLDEHFRCGADGLTRSQRDLGPRLEWYRATIEGADADSRALNILQNCHRLVLLCSGVPHPFGKPAMAVVITMGEVETGDIHPSRDEVSDCLGAGYCGAQCRNYLCLSHGCTLPNLDASGEDPARVGCAVMTTFGLRAVMAGRDE